jgi:pimeloyl-ACP methyl ester carboxylesterase
MEIEEPQYPGARAPDRIRTFESRDAQLNAYEWGDPSAPPILLCHGFFDHGRGFDLLAPILAEHYRVISLDARGHGNSSWSDAYLWPTDVMDVLRVVRELGPETHLIGHSKGGGQVTDAATLCPDLRGKLVNLDGFGPPDEGFLPPGAPDQSELSLPQRCAGYLDRQRKVHERVEWRPSDSLDDLVERRARQNPKLDRDWLRYFVYHGARQAEDGWRWKGDPMLVGGGFGPFRPDWIAPAWINIPVTMLAVIGSVEDHWGPLPEDILTERLAYVPRLERATIEGSGHFIQMERPVELARVILDFLATS